MCVSSATSHRQRTYDIGDMIDRSVTPEMSAAHYLFEWIAACHSSGANGMEPDDFSPSTHLITLLDAQRTFADDPAILGALRFAETSHRRAVDAARAAPVADHGLVARYGGAVFE